MNYAVALKEMLAAVWIIMNLAFIFLFKKILNKRYKFYSQLIAGLSHRLCQVLKHLPSISCLFSHNRKQLRAWLNAHYRITGLFKGSDWLIIQFLNHKPNVQMFFHKVFLSQHRQMRQERFPLRARLTNALVKQQNDQSCPYNLSNMASL